MDTLKLVEIFQALTKELRGDDVIDPEHLFSASSLLVQEALFMSIIELGLIARVILLNTLSKATVVGLRQLCDSVLEPQPPSSNP